MQAGETRTTRIIGAALIAYAIGFNLPYSWLAAHFDYPAILRRPPGEVLAAFAQGGTPLILGWLGFMAAALLLAPVAIGVARVTRRGDAASAATVALGVAAAVTQAIGLSRWVYAVPGLAASWTAADPAARPGVETLFLTLHQFAGVGIGEAIGQTLTAAWLIAVALDQRRHPRFGGAVAAIGFAAGAVLLVGLAEGFATVLAFDPGLLGLAPMIGFLLLTVWMIWSGILCLLRPGAEA